MAAIKKLLKKSYTVKDVNALMTESLFRPVNGKTLGEKDAAKAIVKVAAQTGANVSPAVVKMAALKANPAPKRKTAARTQRAADAYVRRPSQITKKAPSKRLKKRRTVNLQSPRGVFPNPITKFIVYSETKPGQWKQVKVTENFDIAKNLAISNANSGYASTVEDSVGTLMYDTTRPTKYELKKNPDSVHFDIDVNSHNARGSKAKTRTNPVSRVKAPAGREKFIRVELKYGNEWEILSLFPKTNEGAENAIMYAKAYHVKEPKATIRVME